MGLSNELWFCLSDQNEGCAASGWQLSVPKAEKETEQKEKCEDSREALDFFPLQTSQNNSKINALGHSQEGRVGE